MVEGGGDAEVESAGGSEGEATEDEDAIVCWFCVLVYPGFVFLYVLLHTEILGLKYNDLI